MKEFNWHKIRIVMALESFFKKDVFVAGPVSLLFDDNLAYTIKFT